MFDLKLRLEHASIACNPREYAEDEQNKVGREAEKTFASTLLREGGLSSRSIFYGLRVPDEYQSRKREIDLVLLHDSGIYTLEIKNWSGKVRLSKDKASWIQSRHKIVDGEHVSFTQEIEHENGLKTLRRKTRLLRDHLFRFDVVIPEQLFKPRVVFVNRNTNLDDEIAGEKEIITSANCQAFVESFQRGYVKSVLDSFVPGFISGLLSYSVLSMASNALSSIGTWDIIELNGSKRLYGDFKTCPYFSVDRKQTECLELSHKRSRLTSTTWALLGYTPSVVVSFRQRGGTGWLWSTYRAVVNIPYDTELTFRICGEVEDSKIMANDIYRILLSV